MSKLKNLLNQRITFAQQDPEPTGVTFTEEQWATIVTALELEPEATADDVVAAVTALVEVATNTEGEQVAASAAQPVVIDGKAWQDMQDALKVGVNAKSQAHRLAAEQVVDQAIKLSKASPTHREQWIDSYLQDPDKTVHALNNSKEIPRMMIGHGSNEEGEPTGWVR